MEIDDNINLIEIEKGRGSVLKASSSRRNFNETIFQKQKKQVQSKLIEYKLQNSHLAKGDIIERNKMTNKLAINLIHKTLTAIDGSEAKMNWLQENSQIELTSGFDYLPKFFMFPYVNTEKVDSDYTKFVVVKVSFGMDYDDVTEIEYFDSVVDYILFAVNNCDVDHTDLNCSELDLIFSYSKQFSLDTICSDIGYYEIDDESDYEDAHYIIETNDGYFQEVDKNTYDESGRQAGVIKDRN